MIWGKQGMTIREAMTENEIAVLLGLPKIIRGADYHAIRPVEKNGVVRFNVEVKATSDETKAFTIFSRVLVDDPMDFSVGLRVKFQDGSRMILMRCNGLHGGHTNHIEHERLEGRHIHIATERYVRRGHRDEGYAIDAEDKYNNAESAFNYLMKRCNISIEGQETTLFGE